MSAHPIVAYPLSSGGGGTTPIPPAAKSVNATGTASVTLTIPSGYNNLKVVFSGSITGGTGGAGLQMSFTINGDSGTNYQWSAVSWPYSSGAASLSGAFNASAVPQPSTGFELTIPDYARQAGGTQLQFFSVGVGDNAGANIIQTAGQYNSTNPVTSITFTAPGGTFIGLLTAYLT